MSFVGPGAGAYAAETTFKYVGYGGDFGVVRRRRDFTCVVFCCLLPLLLLLPLALWWICQPADTDCDEGFPTWEVSWSENKKALCCAHSGRGCHETQPTTALPETTPTVPPTPFPTPPPRPQATRPPAPPTRPPPTAPPGPVDPFNCAVDQYFQWAAGKKEWCCRIHHLCGQPTEPPRPADPYNCADGFSNWQAGWSLPKKEWCCRVHGKGCPGSGGGCVTEIATTSPRPYDCDAGFANWSRGWSTAKKDWCCKDVGKGCPQSQSGCV